MDIVYCHHANREKGNPPTDMDDISSIGVQDAENMAKLFEKINKKEKFTAIYSSRHYRCKRTVDIINKELSLPVFYDDRLREKPREEDWVECQERLKESLIDIIKKHDNKDIVIVVTSGVNVVSFINLAYGLESSKDAPYIGIPSCSPMFFTIDKEKFAGNK